MKKRTALFFVVLYGFVFSQTKDGPMAKYYSYWNLSVDSAVTPDLYYQIYNWVGTKYRYAGNCKEGVDCSGFVNEIYKNVYCITLNGGSRDMFKQLTPVSKKNLREGDLVFFKIRKNTISHVGIYLAHDKFAHATTKAGVTISDLNDDYYKKYFYKGGRLKKTDFLKNQ